jgi:hypothetical protein
MDMVFHGSDPISPDSSGPMLRTSRYFALISSDCKSRFPQRTSESDSVAKAGWLIDRRLAWTSGHYRLQNKTSHGSWSHGTLSRTALPRSLLTHRLRLEGQPGNGSEELLRKCFAVHYVRDQSN